MSDGESTSLISLYEISPVLIPYLLGFLIFRGFFGSFPLFLQLEFHLNDVQTVQLWSEIGSIAFFFGAISRLPAGLLSDKIGRLKAFALGYTIFLISLALIYFFNIPLIFALALSLIRFGVNTFAMTGRAIVSAAKRDRGLKNGLLSAMVGLGSFSGPYVFAYSLDHFQPKFIVILGFILVVSDLLIFLFIIERMPKLFSRKFPNLVNETDYSPVNGSRKLQLSVFRKDGVIIALSLFTLAGLMYGMVSSVYAVYGYNILKLDLTFVGFIVGLGPLVQVFWAPLVGKLYDYVKDEDIRMLGWFIAVLGSISVIFSNYGVIFFILGFVLLNLSTSTYFTMEITALGKNVNRNEFSFAFGVISSMSILGTAISNYLSPYFYKINPNGTFIVALVIALPTFLYTIYLKLRVNRE